MEEPTTPSPQPPAPKPICGLVMPISAIDGCSEQHWSEVKAILIAAIESAGFEANLVSDADDVGIIQKRIVQNLYENPIVVCDASGKNPNVMFELGLRLAFDKPTVIVKDDKTSYSFDTSPIEHLGYPRDLRFAHIVAFQKALSDKVRATHEKSANDPQFTTFLKHFGQFTVAKLDTKEVSNEDIILDELRELRRMINRVNSKSSHSIPAVLKGRMPEDPLRFLVTQLVHGVIQNKFGELVGGNIPRDQIESVVNELYVERGYELDDKSRALIREVVGNFFWDL